MSDTLPKDPVMLYSFLNTQLRDRFSSLSECCDFYGVSREEMIQKLKAAGFSYDKNQGQFR